VRYIVVKRKLDLDLNVYRNLTNYLYLTSYILKLRYRYNVEAIEKIKSFYLIVF